MALIRWLTTVALCAGVVSIAHATESVWDALRVPGSVVVLRHSYAPSGFDPPDARLDDCSTQRNLDDNGRAQARRIGEAFRKNAIAVGLVLSSPRCRCLDTARLAFGQAQSWEPLQGALRDAERRQQQLVEIRKAIAAHRGGAPPGLGTPRSRGTHPTGARTPMGRPGGLRPRAPGTPCAPGP